MAFVAGETDELEARRNGDLLGQGEGLVGRSDATAMHAFIHVDEYADGASCRRRRLRQLVDLDRIVHRGLDVRLPGEQRQRPRLLGAHDLVDNEYVGDAGAGHDDGFPHGRTTDADGAVFDFQPGDVRALVDLHVRPQRRRDALHMLGHEAQIRLQDAQVEQQGGRRQLLTRAPDRRSVHVADALMARLDERRRLPHRLALHGIHAFLYQLVYWEPRVTQT